MAQGLPPSALNGTTLPGLLTRWGLLQGPARRPSPVDGLAGWLGWAHAIPLASALQAPVAVAAALPDPERANLAQQVHDLRERLLRGLRDAPAGARRRHAAPRPDDLDTHRRRYQACQQAMQAAIAPLRSRLREALARRAPALAALDALWADLLEPRQQEQLALLPTLLERRFEQLHAAPEPGAPDRFAQDMNQLLHAELDLRLLPLQGLLDALGPPSTTTDD